MHRRRVRAEPLGDEVRDVIEARRHERLHVIDIDEAIVSGGQCRKALDRAVRRAGLALISDN